MIESKGKEKVMKSPGSGMIAADREIHYKGVKIAILVPCYNEELTIKEVIGQFRRELPEAVIYVYDNNSNDRTAEFAKAEGAVVGYEKKQGKGFVVATMLEEIESDIYVLVDGDDTYPAEKVHELLDPINQKKADMVVGNRFAYLDGRSFRPFHIMGNKLVVQLVNVIFGSKLTDIMSGYRAFNDEFAKKVPIISRGFEVETQMTLQALFYNFVISEVPITYKDRPRGSTSKLNTFRDGFKIILKIFDIFKAYRPLLFFFFIGVFFSAVALLIGLVPVIEYLESGTITRVAPVIFSTGILLIAVIMFSIGLILDALNHRLRELIKMLSSLNVKSH